MNMFFDNKNLYGGFGTLEVVSWLPPLSLSVGDQMMP